VAICGNAVLGFSTLALILSTEGSSSVGVEAMAYVCKWSSGTTNDQSLGRTQSSPSLFC